jgi:hypothetical protein
MQLYIERITTGELLPGRENTDCDSDGYQGKYRSSVRQTENVIAYISAPGIFRICVHFALLTYVAIASASGLLVR